jgi:serine/threonine-protein kinase
LVPPIATAIASIDYRGIVSPFAHAILCILTAFALARPLPARRAWPWLVAIVGTWPLVMLCATRVVPGIARQLEDPRLAADFREITLALLVGGLLAGAGQDAQWRVRRKVLLARRQRRYELGEVLGEGGMGTVYRAWHAGLRRHVALKILREHGDPSLVTRFVREVRATAVLEHPCTVRVLDCGATEDGRLFYTMELLDGRSLHALVRREGGLPVGRAMHLLLQACRALGEAHEKGLVHRDVKPENLFVATLGGEGDVLKVLDFGIAKSLAGDTSLTAHGALVGTPRYMSLEQALGEPVDARTDVHALGVVGYFMLTGRAPIDADGIVEVVWKLKYGDVPPLLTLRPDVPAAIAAVLMRCLSSDPDARYADARALADALEAAMESRAAAEHHVA